MRRSCLSFFFISLSLLLGLRLPVGAAQPGDKRFRLVYANSGNFGIALDVLGALEKALRREWAQAKIEKIELVGAYYSKGNFLISPTADLKRENLPSPKAARSARGQAAALETPMAAIWVSSGIERALLDKIFDYAREVSDEERADAPGIVKTTGRLWEMSSSGLSFEGVSLSEEAPDHWSQTMAVRYHVRVDGRTEVVTIVGKPLGGPGRVRLALLKRKAESPEPEFLINFGGVGISANYGLPKDAVLKTMADSGFKVLAFSSRDADLAWDEMASFSSSGRLRALCTNLKGQTTAQVLPFDNVHVENIAGLKVGVISLISKTAQAVFRRKKLPYEVEEPLAAAKAALRELRGKYKVDLVAAVSHLPNEEELKVFNGAGGIDIFLSDYSREVVSSRKATVELSDWSREGHSLPALRVQIPELGFGEVAVSFRDSELGPELARLQERWFLAGPDAPEDESLTAIPEAILRFSLRPREPLLPDPRNLWVRTPRPKLVYDPVEFWNLAAGILRRETRSEVSLLRINPLGSNVTGELSERFPQQWMTPDHPIYLVRLPGAALKSLRARIPFDEVPVLEGAPPRDYSGETWLAASGLDKQGRVSGVPISDDESYTVAATEELLNMTESLSALQAASDPKPTGRLLSESVLGALKSKRKSLSSAAYDSEVRRGAEGKSPVGLVWRLNLRELSLQAINTQVANNSSFSQVRDARVQAVNQLYTAGTAKLFSELYWNRWRWDAGFAGDYGRVTIRPPGVAPIVNTTQDKMVLETELRHRTWSLSPQSLRPSLGPFVNVAYDTEFVKPEERPKREFVRYKAGMKLFDGSWLKEVYAGGLAESDYSARGAGTRYGYATGLALASPIPGTPVIVKADVSYVEFERSRRDTAADLKRRLDVNVRLAVPLMRDLRLSPFVSYYLFEGAVVRATGYNIVFGVALDYSKLWKPFY